MTGTWPRATLLVAALTWITATAAAHPPSPVDTLGIYSEVTGNYEFYFEEQYSPIKIYLHNGILTGRERGRDPITLTPVNLDSLQFSAYNGREYFRIAFFRNEAGGIGRLVLAAADFEAYAERVAETALPPVFSVEELRHDLQQLRTAMEENSAIIYEFVGKGTYDRLFDEKCRQLTRPMSTEEFRTIIAPLVAKAGCIHTSLWMPPGYWINAGAKLIPLRPVFLKDTCYVWRRLPEAEEIREGSEITAIDGISIPDILAVLKANVSADGYNESFRKFKMNEGFIFRYALDFGFRDTFEITYRLPGEKAFRTAIVKAVDLETAERNSLGKNSTEYNTLDYTYGLEVLEDSTIAIITARTFAFYDRPETFTSFIDSAFSIIHGKHIQNLILDIRNNDGGNPFCTAHLFSYLEPAPLPYFAEEYGKYASLAHPIPRAQKPFTGRLYTLINGNNVSTTPHFCALLKYHKIGTFVGMETGGTFTCNAATHDIHLKNTRFILTVSTKPFAAAVKGFSRSRGIVPDVTVVSTIDDLLNRRDAQKAYVLRLIKHKE